MRRLADEIEKEEAGDKSKATEDRIAALEKQLAKAQAAAPAQVNEALEEITDEEYELIRARRAGKQAPPAADPPPPPVEEKPKRTRPGRKNGAAYSWTVDEKGKVQKTDIAHIYSGEDEPNEVPIPDDDVEEPAA